MPDAVDWDALKQVFATPTTNVSFATDEAALARELAEERAAIMEYDGGLSRKKAEALVFQNLAYHMSRKQN